MTIRLYDKYSLTEQIRTIIIAKFSISSIKVKIQKCSDKVKLTCDMQRVATTIFHKGFHFKTSSLGVHIFSAELQHSAQSSMVDKNSLCSFLLLQTHFLFCTLSSNKMSQFLFPLCTSTYTTIHLHTKTHFVVLTVQEHSLPDISCLFMSAVSCEFMWVCLKIRNMHDAMMPPNYYFSLKVQFMTVE